MSGHGGARPGAGRKKGSLTTKTREIAEKAAASGVSPLEVILFAMREAYERREYREAAGFANMAAPYCHPRLSAVEYSGPFGGPIETAATIRVEDLSDEQLAAARAFHAASLRCGPRD